MTPPHAPAHQPLRAVPFADVQIQDGFWSPRLTTNREKTLPHLWRMFAEDGRFTNFQRAAAGATGGHRGFYFNDGLFYSALEGLCAMLSLEDDPLWAGRLEEAVAMIAAAQQGDGYLSTYFILQGELPRWSDLLFAHELYNAGMLFQAAAAHCELTGTHTLLAVAERLADHIWKVFGPGRRPGYPGHPAIEMGLLRLYRLTGEARYGEMASFFVEARGRPEARREMYSGWSVLGPEAGWPDFAAPEARHHYMQAHLPVREQTTIHGHAVRATYLYAGVAELAALTGDLGYLLALDRLWEDMTARKMYITGGIGVSGHGEGFSTPYDLPNEQAYAETCAAIGLVFWAHRMNLLTGDARYVDGLERALYNGLIAGVSLDGDQFTYINPLASRGVREFEAGGGTEAWIPKSHQHRRHWFRCACCPPNVLRLLPMVGGYVFALDADGVVVNLYMGARTQVEVGGAAVRLAMETDYPWDGRVVLKVACEPGQPFTIKLRIPGWCNGARLHINGQDRGELVRPDALRQGYAAVTRQWQRGDLVELELPMPVQRIVANPRVAAGRGRAALQRGPTVYCLEAADNGGRVYDLSLPRDAVLSAEYRADLLGGVAVVKGTGDRRPAEDWEDRLYAPAEPARPAQIVAVPYASWDNREPGEMVVWIPESPSLAEAQDTQGP